MAKYIECEALIEHMKDLPTWWADSGGVYGQAMKYPEGMFDCDDVINSVDNAPAADVVEVKHGEWLSNAQTDEYVCSKCDGIAPVDCEKEDFYKSNYCPNCGAKMDGERKCNDA